MNFKMSSRCKVIWTVIVYRRVEVANGIQRCLTDAETILSGGWGCNSGIHQLVPKISGSKDRQEVLEEPREEVDIEAIGVIDSLFGCPRVAMDSCPPALIAHSFSTPFMLFIDFSHYNVRVAKQMSDEGINLVSCTPPRLACTGSNRYIYGCC